ncbi:MAG: chromosome segregation protein SMC [Clostridia bacterium]|nr:chromosome segregation protein SMC [Clostridia bacterium]
MYLKSLELYGFKSFPDRVKIDFGSGMTGIVGPNGSGKSNISDAIRWVLGEQSSKMLRGNKTEDVVFSGTEKRKPLGLAEVSLVFDNTANFLKHDADEVTITRRYYLSGESEYRINKKQVRLRDVRELFMDTGLGRDGYSVIGQGKIDEILSQKSEDRREIFEEAAGISKYRSRKDEAERKLRDAADNLARLADIVSELETQIAPLEKKAAKAAAYLLIHDELRELETDIWCERLEELKVALTKTTGSLTICETMLSEARLAQEKLYAESEQLTEEIGESDREAESLRQALHSLEALLAEENSAAAAAAATLEQLTQQRERLERELAQREGAGSALERELAQREESLSDAKIKADACSAGLTELYERSAQLSEDVSDSAQRLDGIRALEAAAQLNITDAQSALSANRTLDAELAVRLREEDALLSAAREARAGEKAQVDVFTKRVSEQAEAVAGLQNTINGYRMILAKREESAKHAADEKMRLTMESSNLTSRMKMLSDLQRDYEGYSKAVKVLMQLHARGSMPGLCGTVGELIAVDGEHTLAIETALGAAMQNIITQTDEDAKEAINYLKRNDIGRATFLPISAVHGSVLKENGLESEAGFVGLAVDLCSFAPIYQGVFNSLLGRTAVFERLDSAMRTARRFNHRFRIVTLDGQVINAGGSMTGGSAGRNTGILSRANEIHLLDEKVQQLADRRKQVETRADEAERQLKEIRYQTELAETEKRTADDKLLSLRLAAEQQQRSLQAADERIRSVEENHTRLTERVTELAAQRNTLEATIRSATAEANELRAKADALAGEQTDTERRRSSLAEMITEQRVQLAALTAQVDSQQSAVNALKAQIAAAAAEGENVRGEIAAIEARVETLTAEDEARAVVLQGYRDQIQTTEAETKVVIARRMDQEARRSAADAGARSTSDRIIELEREFTRLENTRNDGENEQNRITTQMWENYELTPGEAALRARPVENKTQMTKRIAELRAKKRSLGDVDTGAIDELKQVKERHSYLTAQQSDLEKSSHELTELIENITEEMKTLFEKTFDEINDSFGTVFREIFGGGRAELVLADRSDLLNCGIEIHVQPPGKSLKFLSLLSGGEKALVAIALYFSILRIRPAPFCILDEIDAALDEQNVARFATYLSRFSGKTQFILITHRRGTMEMSDRIYGITMQEQGISKVIPLNMAEVEKRFMKNAPQAN